MMETPIWVVDLNELEQSAVFIGGSDVLAARYLGKDFILNDAECFRHTRAFMRYFLETGGISSITANALNGDYRNFFEKSDGYYFREPEYIERQTVRKLLVDYADSISFNSLEKWQQVSDSLFEFSDFLFNPDDDLIVYLCVVIRLLYSAFSSRFSGDYDFDYVSLIFDGMNENRFLSCIPMEEVKENDFGINPTVSYYCNLSVGQYVGAIHHTNEKPMSETYWIKN